MIKTVKLLTEDISPDEVEVLCEKTENEKIYRLRCPFMLADSLNRNQRIYREWLCDRETENFKKIIERRLSLGEWQHPQTPEINRERGAILVEDITKDGKMYIGTAKVLTKWPMGRLLYMMLEEKMPTGISSRSTGTVDPVTRYVNDDLKLITFDAVENPSCQVAIVDSIIAEKEYIIENDRYVEIGIHNMQRKLDKDGSKVIAEALRDLFRHLKAV